jgi:hypothetical protein
LSSNYGAPWTQGNQYGTYGFGSGHPFISVGQIATGAEAFALGFSKCSMASGAQPHLTLIVGTSNGLVNGTNVTSTHGQAWAGMVNGIEAWLVANNLAAQVTAAGGSDIELSPNGQWSTPTDARSWVAGYVGAAQEYLYDYGDAADCPQAGATGTPGNCNAGPNGTRWTQDDVWFVSWGTSSGAAQVRSLPQIYTTPGSPVQMARQWQQLSLYAYLRPVSSGGPPANVPMTIAGELTQSQACVQKQDCSGTNNTPTQGWTLLENALYTDARTAQFVPWSTDIKWQ